MKHGSARAAYMVICVILPWFIGLAVFPYLLAILSFLPSSIKEPVINMVMLYAGLFRVNFLLPIIALTVTVAVTNYYLPKTIGKILDFADSRRKH